MTSVITRFDHVIVGVRDLGACMGAWREAGFDVVEGGCHPGRGTYNAIVRFGLDYLELLSLYSRDEALATGGNGAAAVRLLDAREGGMLGYALAADDIDGLAASLTAAGIEVAGPIVRSRVRPDGRTLGWRLLFPFGTTWGTPWPMFIQWDGADADRLEWERPGRHENGVTGVAGLRIAVPDLAAASTAYERMGLGAGPRRNVGGTWIELAERPDSPGGVAEVVLSGSTARPATTLLGTPFSVAPRD